MFAGATVLQANSLQALGIDLPEKSFDLLLNLPLPVNSEGGNDGTDEEDAEDDEDGRESDEEDVLMNHKGLNREEVRFSLDRDAAAGRYQLC